MGALPVMDRRKFFKNSAVFGSALILPSLLRARIRGANSRIGVAIVGWGGQGRYTVRSILESADARIVALCDVDENRVAQSYTPEWAKPWLESVKGIPRFSDYRIMLDKMDKDIDAVAVCTPDHVHYPICAWAMAKGKHVFCEKPLTRTIWESREIRRMAEEAGVCTQMGNQVHTNDGWRTIREWCDAGIMGQIEDIYAWTDRSWGFDTPPQPTLPVPKGLDFNLWLNIAPQRPYSKDFVPYHWRGLRDFGTGSAGDMACHFLDNPYSAFNLGLPYKIVSDALPCKDFSWPKAASIDMFFKNKYGKDGEIRLHWYDGRRRPPEIKGVPESELKDPKNDNAIYIVGTKQTMTLIYTGSGVKLMNRDAQIELKKAGKIPPKTIPRNKFPYKPQIDWANACVEGRMPESNFSYAAPFTELALLGMISCIHPGVELLYDPNTMSFKNYPDANKFTRSLYDYRMEFLPSAPKI